MFTHQKKQKFVSGVVCIALFLTTFAFTPINHRGEIQTADALVVFDPKNAAINTQNTVLNGITSSLQNAFYIKEFTLDGIAHGLAKMILKSMTQSILNWINSGFQGSPAFITDLKQFMLDRIDQAVGEFIYNDPSLNFLCSPFKLDVKIALATSYQESTRDGFGSKAQCTLSQVTDNVEGFLNGAFDEGGWESWFEMTQNPVNTPVGARLAAETEMYARIVDEQGRTVKELDWGDGFLSFKVCDDKVKQTNCTITTPGRVIADQINKSLGAGQDALITADEINEIISALFAQLAKQVLTGLGGLRGVSSPGGFNDPTGSTTRSYLDAMGAENENRGVANPFTKALENEQKNTTLQEQIVGNVDEAEARLDSAIASYGSCITTELPVALITARDNAFIRIDQNAMSIAEITDMEAEFSSATTTAETQLALVEELMDKQQDGTYTSITENALLQVTIDYELQETIDEFVKDLNSNINSCDDSDR